MFIWTFVGKARWQGEAVDQILKLDEGYPPAASDWSGIYVLKTTRYAAQLTDEGLAPAYSHRIAVTSAE